MQADYQELIALNDGKVPVCLDQQALVQLVRAVLELGERRDLTRTAALPTLRCRLLPRCARSGLSWPAVLRAPPR